MSCFERVSDVVVALGRAGVRERGKAKKGGDKDEAARGTRRCQRARPGGRIRKARVSEEDPGNKKIKDVAIEVVNVIEGIRAVGIEIEKRALRPVIICQIGASKIKDVTTALSKGFE